MSLDEGLRRALARRAAPADLVARVLRGLQDPAPEIGLRRRSRVTLTRWILGAAASLVILTGAGRFYLLRDAARDAERIKHDVVIGLQVASEKLALVQRKLHER